MRLHGLPIVLILLCGCSRNAVLTAPEWPDIAVSAGVDAKRLSDARQARAALLSAPRDEGKIIWYGRRLAYLGFYEQAIEVYTRGLALHPQSPRLLRHRGHREISTRNFDAAIADFERAAALIQDQPDQVEPDGMPNARNIPTSSLHTNIWYHLGLARYCRGEFEVALQCYESCLKAAKNPDMQVATRYWKLLAATRCGNKTAATAAHTGVEADWDVIENHAYHRLLLLFRGDLKLADFGEAPEDEIKNMTLAYGLARYQIMQGDAAAGRAALKLIAEQQSPAFGCIAAEADLAR